MISSRLRAVLRRPCAPRRAAALLFLAALAAGFAAGSAEAVDAKYRNAIRAARRYTQRGQPGEAAKVYQGILTLHPTDEQASTGYAQALIDQEQYDAADVFLSKALESVTPKVNLYRKREQLRRLQGRAEDAFADALEVLGESEGLAPWVFQETQSLLGEGLKPSDAVRRAREALANRPDDANFVVLTGVILALDDRGEEALALVREEDRKKKRRGRTIQRYAEEILALGRRDAGEAAMGEAAAAAAKGSRRSQVLFNLAGLLEEDGRYPEALAQLATIAAEREGTSAAGKALIQSAEIYQNHLDDPRGALDVYEKLRDDPSIGHYRPRMLIQMGDCFVRLGDFDAAAKTYRSVLPEAIDPEDAEEAAFKEAEVAFYRGDADSARTLYQDMAEAYPRSLRTDDAAGRYILINAHAGLGAGDAIALLGRVEWGKAIGDSAVVDSAASRLIALYPEGELAAEAWLARADLAEAAGHYTAALEYLDRVVADHAEDHRAPEALRRQGDIYLDKLDRPEEALRRYERILTDYAGSVLAGEVRLKVEAIRRGLKS